MKRFGIFAIALILAAGLAVGCGGDKKKKGGDNSGDSNTPNPCANES